MSLLTFCESACTSSEPPVALALPVALVLPMAPVVPMLPEGLLVAEPAPPVEGFTEPAADGLAGIAPEGMLPDGLVAMLPEELEAPPELLPAAPSLWA